MREEKINSVGGRLDQLIVAAHELKSPLALVRQLALSLGDNDVSTQEKQDIIHKIQITAEQALRLTTNLTKSRNLEDSLFNLEPINPTEICKDILCELNPLMKLYKKKVIFKNSKKNPLLVIANRDLLRRILLNFADNAVYYGNDEEIEVAIKSLKRNHKIRVSFRDRGPSVSKKQFYSLINNNYSNKKMTSRPESSGLGIYLANQFAVAMGANIGLIRHKDGVSFYVDLNLSSQMSLL